MEPSTRKLKGLRYENNPDIGYVTTHHESHYFDVANTREELAEKILPFEIPNPELDIELVSDVKKVLFKVDDSFYHFFIDSLPIILKLHREHPDVFVVLYLQTARKTVLGDQLIEMLELILDGEGVNYKFVKIAEGFEHAPVLKISNYSVADPYFSGNNFTSFVDVLIAVETVVKYTKIKLGLEEVNIVPSKKVFIYTKDPNNWVLDVTGEPDYSGYLDDIRMEDIHKLQKYFESMGYETVDPTKDFDSLYEQIIYMMNVKTLAAVTASGLANMIFMQPNQLVIEIQAEIVQNLPVAPGSEWSVPMQGVHTMYSMLTFMKDHALVSIPSHRKPDDVIKRIESTILKEVVSA